MKKVFPDLCNSRHSRLSYFKNSARLTKLCDLKISRKEKNAKDAKIL